MTTDTRIGYHVEERYFATKVHQASAFAQFRANQYDRQVDVELVDHKGNRTVADTKYVQRQVA